MSTSLDLFMAILSMDAYNRGYNAGIVDPNLEISNGGQPLSIGTATILQDSSVLVDGEGNPIAQEAGFYAVAYDWNGQTVISYRGTDNLLSGLNRMFAGLIFRYVLYRSLSGVTA